jgi:single-stranded-DNA-specific exonuclease
VAARDPAPDRVSPASAAPDGRDPARLAAARELLLAAEAVVPHTDADGLAAGAQVLRARGEGADAAVLLPPGVTPWGREGLPAGLVALLDLGIRELPGPAVLVDHHVPEAVPGPGQLALSGHGEDPETCTAALVRRVLPEGPAWLAALGAFGDLGAPGLDLPECRGAGRTAVRKLTPLVNAPRRLRDQADGVRTALALLVEHDDPRAALADPRVAVLEAARTTWRAAFDRAVRTAPQVGPRVAVLRFDEPAQVHPLVATTWERRLRPRPVLAANAGWLPGRVNFAVRGGPPDLDLRLLLRDALPEGAGHEMAHGHSRATGGSLPEDLFSLLLKRLTDM